MTYEIWRGFEIRGEYTKEGLEEILLKYEWVTGIHPYISPETGLVKSLSVKLMVDNDDDQRVKLEILNSSADITAYSDE